MLGIRELMNTTLDLQAKDDSALRCLPFQSTAENPIPDRVLSAVGMAWGGARRQEQAGNVRALL